MCSKQILGACGVVVLCILAFPQQHPIDPIGPNPDPDLTKHDLALVLPVNAGPEIRKLAQKESWEKLSASDRSRLVNLMARGEIDAANDLAKRLVEHAPATQDAPVPGYMPVELDEWIHSPLFWERITPDEKKALAGLIARGEFEKAMQYLRSLKQVSESPARKPSSANPTSQEKPRRMADLATAYEWNKQWTLEVTRGKFKRGSNKCNQFVDEVAKQAGFEVPGLGGLTGLVGMGGPPAAYQWADPRLKIGCWKVVTDGSIQPGDIVAEVTGGKEHPHWGHVGIVVGDKRTASAFTLVYPVGMIVINDWGFQPEDLKLRVIRRCVQ